MTRPQVSIGLPVYNGENFVAEAIESVLAQTFADWELIISDNASTDRTGEICRAYAGRDERICYVRADVNRGVAWNFNRVFELARGEYFKWMAHDDLNASTQLERLVEVLDRDGSIVLASFQSAVIDGAGELIVADDPGQGDSELAGAPPAKEAARRRNTSSRQPWRRYRGVLLDSIRCYEVFGLMRTDVIRRTRLHGLYRGSEKVFLAEMALHARFSEVPELLFFSRWHDARYSSNTSAQAQQLHFNPRASRRLVLPFQFRCSLEYLQVIFRAPLSPWQRLMCLIIWLRFMLQLRKWPRIFRRLVLREGDTVALPPTIRRLGRHPNMPPPVSPRLHSQPPLSSSLTTSTSH
jgi:glycosyltransferase involved in cell wall biosynthesis